MEFTTRQIAHILAALRLTQGEDISHMPHFEENTAPLSDVEISSLCEQISCGTPDEPSYTVVGLHLDSIEDGDVHDAGFCDFVVADTPLDAAKKARLLAAKNRLPTTGESDANADEKIARIANNIAILAVFAGHTPDLYDPSVEQK
jgi:hypothetical protein